MRNRIPRYLLCTALAVLLTGCEFDYGDPVLAEDIDEGIPDTELYELSHTRMDGAIPLFFIEAEHSAHFEKQGLTRFKNLRFEERDKEGALVTSGRADQGLMHVDSGDIEISGNLHFFYARETLRIEADYLYWSDEEKSLTGQEGEPVRLSKENGTYLQGRGFTADLRRRSVHFSRGVEGAWFAE